MNRAFFNGVGLVALFTFLCGAFTSVGAAEVKIKDKYFKYSGVKYWRNKAENVEIGSYGEKKTSGKYIAVQGDIGTKNIKSSVKFVGPITIDWSKQKTTAVQASATLYVKNTGATAGFTHKKAKSAKLKLMKFYVNEGKLKTVINKKSKKALNYAKDEGGDFRVISEVWVVMEAKIAEEIINSGSVNVSGSQKGVKFDVKAKGSSKTTTSFTLPAGSTFAYLMHKVKKWNKKKGKKTTIKDMEDDQYGGR